MDLFHDAVDRDEINPFVELLWEKGNAYEDQVIAALNVSYLNLRIMDAPLRARMTLEAMQRGEEMIYGGRIEADDLLGEPDLLKKQGAGYIPIDIKSGSGEEGSDDDEGRPKLDYAVQLALYVDILGRMGFSARHQAYILDVHGEYVSYDLDSPRTRTGTESLWQEYQSYLATVRRVVNQTEETLPALAASCKLCHWHSACKNILKDSDDLTLIAELGRAKRDAMMSELPTVADLAECDPEAYIRGNKTVFSRIGPDTLRKFHRRAALLKDPNARPILLSPITLPVFATEIFFDIEVDTMRDLCYLHGFIERQNGDNSTERYFGFVMTDVTEDAEKTAFLHAWRYIKSKRPCAIYYYSKYERTIWRKLQAKYPDVCTADDIEGLFDPNVTIDLYGDVVRSKTDWPTNDQSIKTLAKYLGFSWRDNNPSGAASVQWFDQWAKSRSQQDMQRILDYNEDDCRATRVVLDEIRAL